MITIKKLLYCKVILMTISFGQDMDLPSYSSNQSKATVAWKIQDINIAEIGELSVTPPKISIFIKSDSKLGFKRFTENFNLENLYRYTYQPLSDKEGLFTLFFRRFPVYELFVSNNEIKFIYDKKLKTVSDGISEIKSILPDTTISVN